ncbi:hypothetical protein Moror_2849 [Moniliophthora roreri MCA 2997]|uniref:Uncharacterized protein n=1 Tax=Moniliophthora roreri (strain MCA 2997) TaxID=1381753 RepID=V2XC32_MONRO|nr:hypothetical protein Moror_2849 [Moniliophthora roreri MCA 2997]
MYLTSRIDLKYALLFRSFRSSGQALAGPRGVSGFCLGMTLYDYRENPLYLAEGTSLPPSAERTRCPLTSQLSRKAGWDWNGVRWYRWQSG